MIESRNFQGSFLLQKGSFAGQEKLGVLVLCACCAPQVASRRTKYVPKIFISSYLSSL